MSKRHVFVRHRQVDEHLVKEMHLRAFFGGVEELHHAMDARLLQPQLRTLKATLPTAYILQHVLDT